jgi:hypothetical protein
LITLPELLKDKEYRKFFTTVPKSLVPAPGKKPWRLLVQRKAGGPWARKDFEKYADAFRALVPYLSERRCYDAAIVSRGIAYSPPERIVKVTKGGKSVRIKDGQGNLVQKTAIVHWRPKLPVTEEAHRWCTYCRRPTVFRWFKTHHAFRNTSLEGIFDPSAKRCTICGAREEFVASTLGTARRPGHHPVANRSTSRSLRR